MAKFFIKSWISLLIPFLFSCGSSSSTQEFTIEVSVKGLEGKLVVTNNSEDEFEIEKNGTFTFKAALPTNNKYNLEIEDQPCKQRCVVDDNSGKIPSNHLIKVSVDCTEKSWSHPDSASDRITRVNTEIVNGVIQHPLLIQSVQQESIPMMLRLI